ncbi:hypothetical protein AVEN_192180-1 [Araneus ventricosus]|uniref:Uncharacterized protein n=1 Tax=Araneus ventricosus TaxID=182803 RepID=A0A4Y2J3J7_ARAVE|nr:hypothetical protein AVEN_192180-1 [Araneus ventricosus]
MARRNENARILPAVQQKAFHDAVVAASQSFRSSGIQSIERQSAKPFSQSGKQLFQCRKMRSQQIPAQQVSRRTGTLRPLASTALKMGQCAGTIRRHSPRQIAASALLLVPTEAPLPYILPASPVSTTTKPTGTLVSASCLPS